MHGDLLSEALAAVTTAPALSVNVYASAPWGSRFGGRGGYGFHVVVRGSCWLLHKGADPILLQPGDVVLVPSGEVHTLADPLDTEPVDLVANDRIGRVVVGGYGAETVLLSGAYRMEHGGRHPLLANLPDLVHLRDHGQHRLHTVVGLLSAEIEDSSPGNAAVVGALVDALLIYILRTWYEGRPTGWTAAMNDPAIGSTLHRIHSTPAEPWTVDRLAREAGLARATFTRRFTALVGEPPLTYLTRWRMITAARLLRREPKPLAAIGRQVGYNSEFAFAKAFKREYGLAPGEYRRNRSQSMKSRMGVGN
ncbi:AraC family transcriptional regulator [Nocardia sp. CDC160]|uniref:AraC family transcriptional regulator n=1 Tax=Nocardia sp. CDC160 TaxID=3112166 RepID=UPI002DBB41D5|nr:AraC family transcriptional regulator [Nocardia sp. CDC160]MEC3919291.1 AraC family transcriptional regulator [Nocardia sp. CDC160]